MLALPKGEDKKNIHQTTERRILRKIHGLIKENGIQGLITISKKCIINSQ
jgi:hypothetical protein